MPYASAQDVIKPLSEHAGQHYIIPSPDDTSEIMRQIRFATVLRKTKPDSALNVYQNTLKASVRSSFNNGISLSLFGKGQVLASKGLYDKALLSLQDAIPYCISAKNHSVLTDVYVLISTIYGVQGNYEQTLKYLHWASLLIEKYPSAATAEMIYNNMGAATMQLGRAQQALYYFDKAEKNALQEKDTDFLATILINKGEAYESKLDSTKAQYYFQSVLDIGIKRHLPDIQFISLMNLGDIYLARNIPQRAIFYLLKTQSIQDAVNPYYLNGVTKMLGEAYFELHNYGKAEPLLKKALTTANNLNIDQDLISLHKFLAEIYAQSGRYAQAYEQEKICYTLIDTLTRQKVIQNANQLEIKYRTVEKDKDLIQKQLQINKQEDYLKQKNIWISGISAAAFLLVALLLSLYRSNQHRQKISQLQAVMEGEEKERSRIGQELHDGIGGMLAAVNINIGTVQKRNSSLSEMKELDEIVIMLQDTAAEVRKTAHNLMPDVLSRHTLPEALRSYCDQINIGANLQIDLQFYGQLDNLDKPVALSIYRIMQELVHNIIKHAQATHAAIQIRQHAEKLYITVEDNGIGFKRHENTQGIGLRNLKKRVETLDGQITIESEKQIGTIVYIELSLPKFKKTL